MDRQFSLKGKKIAVFDLESKECAGENGIGWKDYDKIGISVGVAYFYETDEYKVFMDDNINDLADRLLFCDLVTGFNIDGFDIPLLSAITKKNLAPVNTYDVLYYSRRSMGWDKNQRFPSGMKLDDHLEATFGRDKMKTAHGSEAPKMWKEARFGNLISYCMDDVKRERMLFENIYYQGWCATPTHGRTTPDIWPVLKAIIPNLEPPKPIIPETPIGSTSDSNKSESVPYARRI